MYKNIIRAFPLALTLISFSILVNGQLVPSNTATHTAVANGSWFTPSTWNTNTVPSDAAIVYIPMNRSVTYEGKSNAHIFAIQVDGQFHCTQSTSTDTTRLIFDSFFSGMMSKVTFKADGASDGRIEVIIKPFDIEQHKSASPIYTQTWNTNAISHFSDGDSSWLVDRETTTKMRFNTYALALAAGTKDTVLSRTPYLDGVGVLGRYAWDSLQVSLGIMTMGQIEIRGKTKTNMVKLGADAPSQQKNITLEAAPVGWEVGDTILVTRGGEQSTANNGQDWAAISAISGTSITTTRNLKKNHIGRPLDSLHCYVGNMTRNIVFKSFVADTITQRGHLMCMNSDTNVVIKDATFRDMGRTDKNRRSDDFIFDRWLEPSTFTSKVSALGQECIQMKKNPKEEITNMRGRYSIHLHKLGALATSNLAVVRGNVVIGNPGWAITHHDSYADISENNVYQVTGAGIVSETGSELGFWDNNLVVDIDKGYNGDVYEGVTIYDEHSFSGQGLALKGRGVICRGNVIVDANQGIGVMNMAASVSSTDRVDAEALATLRPGFGIDQWPLSVNDYSSEGNGIIPTEVALILQNNTIIWTNLGFKSIERDMGVNHESRSILEGFKLWGINQGMTITYQADYSFKNVFISGKDSLTSLGMYMWKHSHNHLFDGIKFADLEYAIAVSKLVESGNGEIKTRNNGVTPWYFIDAELDNVKHFYEIKNEDPTSTYNYVEHTDNAIHLTSSQISSRPTTFTILDSSTFEVDIAAGDYRFEVDGIITDDAGAYEMGIEQAPAQGTLRLDYPKRIYEFASPAKFEEYLTANGVYKDTANNDQLYFILDEYVPNRVTYAYEKVPMRIRIKNAPTTGVYANPQIEPAVNFEPKNQLISRFATGTMSSIDTTLKVDTFEVDAGPQKAIDGNTNGRINAQQYQRGYVPLGSISETKLESDPWYELDLGEMKVIDFLDVWPRVILNGYDIEPVDPNFKDFYVLISDSTFGTKNLADARTQASYEYASGSTPVRRFFKDDMNDTGRYVRIQFAGNTKLSIAEIEVIGRKLTDEQCKLTNAIPTLPGTYKSASAAKDGNWVCYCDENDQLLLALDTNGTRAVVADTAVQLQIGNEYTSSWNTSGGIITNSKGGAIFNRKWAVDATTQPTSNVKVKYFFTDAEYNALKDTMANHNGGAAGYPSTISLVTDIQMYKLNNSIPFFSPHDASATGTVILNGNSADTNIWVYSVRGMDHSAEYLVKSFSGGGGGMGASSTPLPVEWIQFTAELQSSDDVLLTWTTAAEYNNDYFGIERSYDGIRFERIDAVPAANTNGVSAYTSIDSKFRGDVRVLYYRIVQVDYNGTSSNTPIRSVLLDSDATNTVNVYPNPSKGVFTLDFRGANEQQGTIEIYSSTGKQVYSNLVQAEKTQTLDLSELRKGVYTLQVTLENNSTETLKLIIQ